MNSEEFPLNSRVKSSYGIEVNTRKQGPTKSYVIDVSKQYHDDNNNKEMNNYSYNDNDSDPESMYYPPRPKSLSWPFNVFPKAHKYYHRMIDRDGDFNQSKGKFSIRKKIKRRERTLLYANDWFHSMINAPTYRTFLIIAICYVIIIFIFSIWWYFIGLSLHDQCNMGFSNFHQAFMFSLETMATIGYGTKDVFFGDCYMPTIVLTLQVCSKLAADGTAIGIIYSRLSRPSSRASTVLFTNNSVIRRIRGKLYLMFQICELRKHQLLEAHIRLYCVRSEMDPFISDNHNDEFDPKSPHSFIDSSTYFQIIPLRITHPSDERGSMLLLCLPQVIVHEINESSPLMPPKNWKSNKSGESFSINNDVNFSNSSDNAYYPDETIQQRNERINIQNYMYDRRIEIIALIEGTDQSSGGSVQARHSYIPDEIKWYKTFVPCVFQDEIDGTAVIDFNLYHLLRDVLVDAQTPGAIASQVF